MLFVNINILSFICVIIVKVTLLALWAFNLKESTKSSFMSLHCH